MSELTLFIFILSCVIIDIVVSLKVAVVLEPRTVERQSTTMECKFDLEGSTFGSVAWGKDGKSFYRFSRRRLPPKEVFTVPGINIDVDKSNMTHVVLKKLLLESTGTYDCTVTTSGGGIQAVRNWANMTTMERDPIPLIITTRKGIFIIDTKDYSAATKWDDAPPVLSVGYHFIKNKIYYGASGGNIINQDYAPERETKLGGALILSEEGLVTSIAVDWLHNILYFTDDYLDSVGMVNLVTERRATLLDSSDGVKNPESIVVDPFQRYLFWGDNDESDKKIVASGLDGKTKRKTIVNTDLRRAILALDLDRRRIYFISNEGLSSCKYDGSQRKLHFQHRMLDNNVNSLSYFDDYIFWSRYETGKSNSGLFFAPFTESDPVVKELPIKSILDVKVFHQDLQKTMINYSCEMIECSHSCAISVSSQGGGSAECSCPDGYMLSPEGTVCKKSLQSGNCEKSVTTVNYKSVCKGELVFEDGFDSDSLDTEKWKHTVRISSGHEMEFVVFDKNPENTFIKNGNLIVKPTLIPDSIVSGGNISLIGCTSRIEHLCQRQAFSYQIIPPVRSALLNTAHNFNFCYGIITIRAKVPRGDWLYPVLNLHATKDFYSPDYSSGVIRLATVKGNQFLTCGGKELGNRNLAAGVMLSLQDNVKSLFVNIINDTKWSQDFHIFKFTWTPDELSFSVDDQIKENILPEGKTLREALGFSDEESPNEWRQGTKITPLDQNFYLSIGVSAGGGLEFPDDCRTGKNIPEIKPWRNFEVKSYLKFWQKKSSWVQTWKDQAALDIDYINVRAL